MKAQEVDKVLGADFRTRALTALIVGPTVLLAIVAGAPWFTLLVIGVGIVGGLEFCNMLCPALISRISGLGVIIAAIAGVAYALPQVIALAVGAALLAGLVDTLRVTRQRAAFFGRNHALLILGALYIGLPLGVILLIRAQPVDGLLWTAVMFITNWGTDAFALIGGRVAGRHKLAPAISPGKTIEGALIGLVLGAGVGLALALIGGITPALALIAVVVVAVATEAGDLFESWAKRRLAVKDSGTLLPGHGGLLDRIDGTLLAAPLLWLVLQLWAGI